MNRNLRTLSILLLIAASAACSSADKKADFDLLIRGGRLVNGTGNPWFTADVGIRGDTIAEIGDLGSRRAAKIIEARGLVVSPGFIDLHTHCDRGLSEAASKANLNYLIQGTTTVVTGNCGGGTHEVAKLKALWEGQGIGTNAVHMVGFGDVREKVIGVEPRAPSPEELEKMKALVRQGMTEGAWGMSTGLEYIPDLYSTTEEIIALAKVAARFGGLYATHMRSEEEKLLDAVREAIRIGEKAGIRVQISHFKSSGRPNWGGLAKAIPIIEEARSRGLAVTADLYPYDKSATTTLETIFNIPHGMEPMAGIAAKMGGADAAERERLAGLYADGLAEALADPVRRAGIRRLTLEGAPGSVNWVAKGGWDNFTIMASRTKPDYVRRMFRDLARETGKAEFDIAADLFIAEKGDLIISLSAMDEADVKLGLSKPWAMVSSDGSAIPTGGNDLVHPRNYGTFPRVLGRYVREEGLSDLAEAVRKMTSLPASVLGLKDRGVVRAGAKADLAIFDAAAIADRATFEKPHQTAAGIRAVIVNGRIAVEEGAWTGALAGRVVGGAIR
jgi:N-acyl-D-aspartate/D-glutamate deacylase